MQLIICAEQEEKRLCLFHDSGTGMRPMISCKAEPKEKEKCGRICMYDMCLLKNADLVEDPHTGSVTLVVEILVLEIQKQCL